MNMVWVAAQQTIIMFLYMITGTALYKTGKLSEQGSRDTAQLLIWLILPAVIIDSFCVPFTFSRMRQLGISFFLGAAALCLSIAISALVFHKNPINNFASAFSNAGFMGIPLVRAVLGEEAVFYTVGIIAMLNILQWTYGVAVLTGEKKHVSLKSIIMNPIFAGTILGIIIFCTGMGNRMPQVISSTFQGLAYLNGPLAMLVLGCYLAQTRPWKMLTVTSLYTVSIFRLVIIPVLTSLLFVILPGSNSVKTAVLCAAAAPVGTNVAVYAQLNQKDYPYACQTVVFSTVLSVISLPVILSITQIFI